EDRSPDGAVSWIDGDAIKGRSNPLVLRGVEGLIGLDVVVALSVAIGVDDERGPTLRLCLIAGLFKRLAVQPADDAARWATSAGPQGVAGVLGKLQMVRRGTGRDEREFSRFRGEQR